MLIQEERFLKASSCSFFNMLVSWRRKCLLLTLLAFILLISPSSSEASRLPKEYWEQMLPKKLPTPSSSPSKGTNSASELSTPMLARPSQAVSCPMELTSVNLYKAGPRRSESRQALQRDRGRQGADGDKGVARIGWERMSGLNGTEVDKGFLNPTSDKKGSIRGTSAVCHAAGEDLAPVIDTRGAPALVVDTRGAPAI
ncbi:hypothetical protein GH714_000856 [Hevea brasiliensis]|uniref:Uncharacterized protein n=1 Tax=Hevea brasiliensis TaxID=3981 RepID=A0A6A6LAK6_HEVBR|nr:hypothetical protein GH714_000856 [Hevea brasiliensis]